MYEKAMLPDGGERKENPGVDLVVEHFSELQEVKKTKRTTLVMFENTPLANWFRENKIVGVL